MWTTHAILCSIMYRTTRRFYSGPPFKHNLKRSIFNFRNRNGDGCTIVLERVKRCIVLNPILTIYEYIDLGQKYFTKLQQLGPTVWEGNINALFFIRPHFIRTLKLRLPKSENNLRTMKRLDPRTQYNFEDEKQINSI